jgi:hypothetical protein
MLLEWVSVIKSVWRLGVSARSYFSFLGIFHLLLDNSQMSCLSLRRYGYSVEFGKIILMYVKQLTQISDRIAELLRVRVDEI